MGSREEFNRTERLIQPGMDDWNSAEHWINCGARLVVIKHGMQGSTAYTCDHQSFSVKPFPVQARKGFGGGDGYASGFLYGVFHGWEIQKCLEYGSAEASMLVRNNSCTERLPDIREVAAFIQEEKNLYGEMVAKG